MLRATFSVTLTAIAVLLLVCGCGQSASPSEKPSLREQYANRVSALGERNFARSDERKAEAQRVFDDPNLDQKEKASEMMKVFDKALKSVTADRTQLSSLQPPEDLLPLHRFLVSDSEEQESLMKAFRSALSEMDAKKLNSVLERFEKYDLARPEKLSNAYSESNLVQGDSDSSLKDIIMEKESGLNFLGWPISTWLIYAWFLLACISTRNKRIWQAAKRGELPATSEEPPGCLTAILIPQYGLLAWLAWQNWQQALSVYIITFVLASVLSIVMETIGMVLMIPFDVIYTRFRRS